MNDSGGCRPDTLKEWLNLRSGSWSEFVFKFVAKVGSRFKAVKGVLFAFVDGDLSRWCSVAAGEDADAVDFQFGDN